MNPQLYTAASGLLAEQRRLELVTNNLANASTPAYRAQRPFSETFEPFGPGVDPAVRTANAAVAVAGTWEAPGPGPVRRTDQPLDVALPPDLVLAVETPSGRRYLRAGNLAISTTGGLVDGEGRPLLGADGKPVTGMTAEAALSADGRILDGENEIGKLLVLSDPERVLRPEGTGLFTAGGRDAALLPAPEPGLRPGWIEGSAADPLSELVNLVEAQRAFESYQKLVHLTMNEVNRRAVNDLAG